MTTTPSGSDFDAWVRLLGKHNRHRQARLHLMAIGAPALPALRRGLHHHDPVVRRSCTNLLDHFVDDDSLPDLVAALDDPDDEVRGRALHALACDACKENACRPGEHLWVPVAIGLLDHPSPGLRAAAMDALGKVVGHRADALDAMTDAGERERVSGLRQRARMLAARGAKAFAAQA
jgi:HEAT repeat protein